MITRRSLLQLTAGAALTAATKRPNIVFLFTDDQRFDTIRALGNPEIHTPNMDRLVKRGTTFTHACIMGGSMPAVCMPSRAMLMTGQSLWHVHDSICAPSDRPKRPFHLFPEELGNAGYSTFGIGKWHNGPSLYNRTFQNGAKVFFGGMSDQRMMPVSDYDPTGAYKSRKPGEMFSSELFANAAVDFIKKHDNARPYLLYVAFTSPHDPRMAPQKYTDMYPAEKMEVPANFMLQHPFDNGEMKVRDEMLEKFPRTKEAIKGHIAGYYAMISEVDAQIGRILDVVDENTIVIFAADNGLAVGRHGLLGKQNLYDHSVRVPLIVCGPGVPKGKKNDSLVYLMDLYPTLAEMAGVSIPATVEGKSLLPLIQGKQEKVRDSVYFAYRHVQRAVRTKEWKLIEYNVVEKRTTQLFNLKDDPDELNNLASKEPGRVQGLRLMLKQWMKQTDDPVTWLS